MNEPVVEVDEKIGIQDIMLELDDDRWKSVVHNESKVHYERR